MMIYFLKFIACSALLLTFYRWLLEKEKMNHFNRFYLLFSIVFSALIPLLVVEISIPSIATMVENTPHISTKMVGETISSGLENQPNEIIKNTMGQLLFWVAWGMVSGGLLIRFCYNIYVLQKIIKGNIIIQYKNHSMVLLPEEVIPFSFGNYIFVNHQAYKQGTIANEILLHEQAHIEQRHTWDVLFAEFILVMAWWNPILWMYRKAIMLNHEFLADDEVINQGHNKLVYQHLLLHAISPNTHLLLASSFNYHVTKKRLIKMNKNTLTNRVWMLQVVVVLFVVALSVIFAKVGLAQTPSEVINKPTTQVAFTQEGVPEAMIEEYQKLIEKYQRRYSRNGKEFTLLDAPNKVDRTRLETIFKAMSKTQQEAQSYIMVSMPILPRASPTEKEFETYKNPKIYGVWIDDKKVPNSALNKYKAADFANVFVSKLYKNAQATIGFKYKFQLNLMTITYYEKYRLEALSENKYFITYNNKKK